jgi:hypothetical protein
MFNDTLANLIDNSAHCAVCRLIANALSDKDILLREQLRFFRIGSYLYYNSKKLRIGALYILPGKTSSAALALMTANMDQKQLNLTPS